MTADEVKNFTKEFIEYTSLTDVLHAYPDCVPDEMKGIPVSDWEMDDIILLCDNISAIRTNDHVCCEAMYLDESAKPFSLYYSFLVRTTPVIPASDINPFIMERFCRMVYEYGDTSNYYPATQQELVALANKSYIGVFENTVDFVSCLVDKRADVKQKLELARQTAPDIHWLDFYDNYLIGDVGIFQDKFNEDEYHYFYMA